MMVTERWFPMMARSNECPRTGTGRQVAVWLHYLPAPVTPLRAASSLRAVLRLNPLAIRVATFPVSVWFSVQSKICEIDSINYWVKNPEASYLYAFACQNRYTLGRNYHYDWEMMPSHLTSFSGHTRFGLYEKHHLLPTWGCTHCSIFS